MPTLKHQYKTDIKEKSGRELVVKNVMAQPRLVKIVVNCGLGEALTNKKAIEAMNKELSLITGQKPQVTHAKHDISSFKLRRGDAIGIKVTLRGKRMNDFFAKLVKIVLPRLRDFRGVSLSGFDGKGGYSLGLSEQIAFPEIEYSQIDKLRGLEVTIVTTGRDKDETKKLLETLGVPFSKSLK